MGKIQERNHLIKKFIAERDDEEDDDSGSGSGSGSGGNFFYIYNNRTL